MQLDLDNGSTRMAREVRAAFTSTEAVCDRCGRELHPWPLQRPDLCSPKHWANCIRNGG